ncbi:MAG: C40 family peptidase [Propionibacteriaceae bacterium]|jgi:cell wall-associated NlpC family hydrolase|nr:C40 family peptidase [Propionibacteriaceae bacterium]
MLRLRNSVRYALIVACAVVLACGGPGLTARADEAEVYKKWGYPRTPKTEQVTLEQNPADPPTEDPQEGPLAVLYAAERQLEEAQKEVDQAQGNLGTAAAQHKQAQAMSAVKDAELQIADLALARATAKENENQALVDAQKENVAAYARAIYQDNVPLISVVTLFGATSTSDLANRAQWTDTVLVTNQVDLEDLKELQRQLFEAKVQSQAALAAATEAKQAADVHTTQTKAALETAQAAEEAARQAIEKQAARRLEAQKIVVHNTGIYEATKENLPLVTQQLEEAARKAEEAHRAEEARQAEEARKAEEARNANTAADIANKEGADRVVAFAKSKIGGRYVYGGEGPGYDCSGLTKMAYASIEMNLPHSATAQFRMGQAVDRNNLQPGDLVFYYSGPSHVAIYVGDGKLVHARSESIGIVMTGIDDSRYSGARRLL